jgi:hypothetical protein
LIITFATRSTTIRVNLNKGNYKKFTPGEEWKQEKANTKLNLEHWQEPSKEEKADMKRGVGGKRKNYTKHRKQFMKNTSNSNMW